MRSSRGVTAIELATVIAILAILSALAGPSFVNLIRSNNVSSVVNTFMSDMRFARSEAIHAIKFFRQHQRAFRQAAQKILVVG